MLSKIKVTLLTGRTIEQGTSKEYGKLSNKYRESVAICEVDPDDMKELGIKEDSNVRVSTEHGSVIVKAKDSKRGPHPKIVYMPYGFWANLLIDSSTDGTGMPTFKGITGQVEPAPDSTVLTLRELLKLTFRKE
ncbi:MAG: molybdopterin dinucleotide-binding protein [Candidatus Bathyarchaeota archaeon]|nr:molybdopterin dinucleotide-binding protein [Candidatus Bathyarchaeota archaeon]